MKKKEVSEGTQLHINDLPEEMFFNIFSRLPIQSLSRYRYVCKPWLDLIQSSRFLTFHFEKHTQKTPSLLIRSCAPPYFSTPNPDLYLLELDSSHQLSAITPLRSYFRDMNLWYRIVASCNGLLCLTEDKYDDPVYLYNPLLGEYMSLPKAVKRTRFSIVSGFGFVDEFKVVRMIYRHVDWYTAKASFVLECEVYTLGTNSWRKIEDAPPYPPIVSPSRAFVNGAVHWMIDERSRLVSSGEHLVSFDLREEKFSLVPRPDLGPDKISVYLFLTVLGGCLSIVDNSSKHFVGIWVMSEYNVKESWTKQFTIPTRVPGFEGSRSQLWEPIRIWKDNEILVSNGVALLLYSQEANTFRPFEFDGIPSRFVAVDHIGSLVSLKMTGMEKGEIERRITSYNGRETGLKVTTVSSRRNKEQYKKQELNSAPRIIKVHCKMAAA